MHCFRSLICFVCGILYSGEVKHNNIILNLFT
ncbi:hypothetical protein VP193E371_P0139 [Vibrio phage 193E37-1]|nr:hypothetical protein VP193E371_P0139 [Vibrio phage 193E37-1]